MQLGQVTPQQLARIDAKIARVSSCVIYYCYRGRNAWWTTWVTHYQPGCMHLSLESAQSFAEARRGQGSVFYIQQLPAICLISERWAVAVTQINSRMPLQDYSFAALPECGETSLRFAYGRLRVYLRRNRKLHEALQSFEHDSNFWTTRQPEKNSVIQLIWLHDGVDAEALNYSASLRAWVSSARGAKYMLWWNEDEK